MGNELKVGNKVNSVKVSLNSDMSIKEIDINQLNVLGISEYYYCLDDPYFSKLARTKSFEFCHSKIEKVSIGEEKSKISIELFGKFRILIYSTSSLKVIEKKINREFKKWINEKIGVYGIGKDVVIRLEKVDIK
jgi:hypothetical protein